MRRAVLVLGMMAAAGCDGLLPDDDVSAVVRVVSENNTPLEPDWMVWYYDPQSEQYDGDHPAECLNAGCTRWGVPPEVEGEIYVAASWSRPTRTDCSRGGYDASPVLASADDPPTVVLQIDRSLESCAEAGAE